MYNYCVHRLSACNKAVRYIKLIIQTCLLKTRRYVKPEQQNTKEKKNERAEHDTAKLDWGGQEEKVMKGLMRNDAMSFSEPYPAPAQRADTLCGFRGKRERRSEESLYSLVSPSFTPFALLSFL